MYIPLELTPLFNVFIIVLLLLFILTGYKKGLLLQLLDFLGLIVALFLAWMFSPAFGALFRLVPKEFTPFQDTVLADYFYKEINGIAWFIILFLAVCFIVFLLKPIVKSVGQIPLFKQLNGLFGTVFSILKLLIISMLVIFVLSTPLFKNGSEIVDKTWLKYISQATTSVLKIVEKPLAENKLIQSFILNPQQASTEDVESMIDWLSEKGVDSSLINQFMDQIED